MLDTHARRLAVAFVGSIFAAVTTGCGAAQTVLKSQIESRCSGMALKGCPELADGVLAYADGDNAKGEAKLRDAAAANSPAQMQALAKTLRPIIEAADEDTAKKLRPVLAILAGESRPSKAGGGDQQPPIEKASAPNAEGDAATPRPVSALAGVETGMASPTVDDLSRSCEPPVAGHSGFCRRVRAVVGPVILTNLYSSGGCSGELFATAGESASLPRWTIVNQPNDRLNVAGRLAIPQGTALYVGIRGSGPPADDAHCAVVWSASRERATP